MKAKMQNFSKLAIVLVIGATLSQVFAQSPNSRKDTDAQAQKSKSTPSFAVNVSVTEVP